MGKKDDDDDLFKMSQNAEFVALSKLVKFDVPDILNVNWDTVKSWMFDASNCFDDNMLKAFIKTQIYRPLFFKHDNYAKFTSRDTSYYCITKKYFIDHNGIKRFLCDSDDEISPTEIKTELDGDSDGEYAIDESSIKYFNITNKFEYDIDYRLVDIESNKFVINDVEFYVVRTDDGSVNGIYFNEFQSNTEGQNQVAKVTDNKFKLNGMEYVIEGNEISIDAATSEFSGDEKEWKCEIVGDRF